MATKPRRKGLRPSISGLLRRTIAELLSSLNRGVRSLATPKGILATVPLIISLLAFLKASYVTTSLFVLFIEPITMEITMVGDSIGPSRVNDFEMFLISEGRETVYTAGINLNIVVYDKAGNFNENCIYQVPEGDAVTRNYDPYILTAKPLTKDYAYELRSGFVVSANTVLPMAAHLHLADNRLRDDAISAALAATKVTNFDQRVTEILLNEKQKSPAIALCISGTAFTSGGSRNQFVMHTDSGSGNIGISYENLDIAAPPTAPGGTAVPAKYVKRLVIRGPSFDHAINLFTARKLSIF